VFFGGLTYNSHPLGCATALETIAVYEDDGLIERAAEMGKLMRSLMLDLEKRHPSVGTSRSIGLFGVVELARRRQPYEPIAPYNGTSDEMAALGRFFRENGLYTFVRWNYFFTNPPLIITEEEMRTGFEIIDRALDATDRAIAA
jgi:taurine--2-oxoglutarate transaminase